MEPLRYYLNPNQEGAMAFVLLLYGLHDKRVEYDIENHTVTIAADHSHVSSDYANWVRHAHVKADAFAAREDVKVAFGHLGNNPIAQAA